LTLSRSLTDSKFDPDESKDPPEEYGIPASVREYEKLTEFLKHDEYNIVSKPDAFRALSGILMFIPSRHI
jgi:hypothetical protein